MMENCEFHIDQNTINIRAENKPNMNYMLSNCTMNSSSNRRKIYLDISYEKCIEILDKRETRPLTNVEEDVAK